MFRVATSVSLTVGAIGWTIRAKHLSVNESTDAHAAGEAERSRILRIGLLAKLQDELLAIVAATQSTVVMVTYDVDEAVLLCDKIVMMTNGPSATIGEVLTVDLVCPRKRVGLAESTQYLRYRKAVIDFLYTRQAHVEKQAA